jgi:hypothetical protein
MKAFKRSSRNTGKETVNYMTLTPMPLTGFETHPDGSVDLLIPRFTSRFWNKYLMTQTSKKHIHLKLDELGSSTWSFIDSNRTVGEICTLLIEKHGSRIHPVEERVTQFLTQLYHNKYITFKELSPELDKK